MGPLKGPHTRCLPAATGTRKPILTSLVNPPHPLRRMACTAVWCHHCCAPQCQSPGFSGSHLRLGVSIRDRAQEDRHGTVGWTAYPKTSIQSFPSPPVPPLPPAAFVLLLHCASQDNGLRFELTTAAPLRHGDQVLICYGPLTSLSFLLSFGFLPQPNPTNHVVLYAHLQVRVFALACRRRMSVCVHANKQGLV